MFKRFFTLVTFFFTFVQSLSAQLIGPYLGQKVPGTTPEIFASGVISLENTSDYACSFSPDGNEFYFTRADSRTQRIMVSKNANGSWTAPTAVTFASGYAAHEPHVCFDNKTIYFGWFHPLPAGETGYVGDYGIYFTQRTTNDWSAPTYAGQGMFVSSSQDGQFYVTDFSTSGSAFLAKVLIQNGKFLKLERLKGGMDSLRSTHNLQAHPCIAPDGSYIIFDLDGGGLLHVCFKKQDETWGEAINLTKYGIDVSAGIASISPDGKYLFFVLNGDIWWVDTQLIKKLDPATNVEEKTGVMPSDFKLLQNYPNPFNPSTTIKFGVRQSSLIFLGIYNILGVLIKTLLKEEKSIGNYSVQWNGESESGNIVPNGVYICRLQSEGFSSSIKLVFIK